MASMGGAGNCITDQAYENAAKDRADAIKQQAIVDAAIEVAMALYQRQASGSIVNMQNDIANRETVLAEQIQAHAEAYWPAETAFVNDMFSEAKHSENYPSAATIYGNQIDSSLDSGRSDWIDMTRTMCIGPSRCEDARWGRNAQLARADALSYSARQEEFHTQALNDRRYARQYAALQLGRGQLETTIALTEVGGAMKGNIADFLTGTINSAYQSYRFNTYIPPLTGWGMGIQERWGNQSYATPFAMKVNEPVQQLPLLQPQTPITPVAPSNPAAATGKAAGAGQIYRNAKGIEIGPTEGGGYTDQYGNEYTRIPSGFSPINGSL